MRQKSFGSGFEKHNKQTRKEKFLSEMDRVIPWKELSRALSRTTLIRKVRGVDRLA